MTVTDSLSMEARDRARRVHVRPEIMEAALRQERGDRPFVVELEAKTSGAAFFRCTQEGPSRVLYLNLDHPFYDTIYSPPESTPGYRDAVEVLLWVLGTSMLDSDDATRTTYLREIQQWSTYLARACPILDDILGNQDVRDRQAWDEEDDEAPAT